MTPAATDALLWAGINPPLTGGTRTHCPKCSPHRGKYWQRCLRVLTTETPVHVRCKHCGYEEHLT